MPIVTKASYQDVLSVDAMVAELTDVCLVEVGSICVTELCPADILETNHSNAEL